MLRANGVVCHRLTVYSGTKYQTILQQFEYAPWKSKEHQMEWERLLDLHEQQQYCILLLWLQRLR